MRRRASSETLCVGTCLWPGRMRSLQISSDTTTQSYLRYSSMARSISQRSQTRPHGLCGEQNTAAWMSFWASLASMSSKSIRQTPSSSILSGECTMERPLFSRLLVKPM